jgi:hypothetical protein
MPCWESDTITYSMNDIPFDLILILYILPIRIVQTVGKSRKKDITMVPKIVLLSTKSLRLDLQMWWHQIDMGEASTDSNNYFITLQSWQIQNASDSIRRGLPGIAPIPSPK